MKTIKKYLGDVSGPMAVRLIITAIVFAFMFYLTSCNEPTPEYYQNQKGLPYKLLGYIGPDSCELYLCAIYVQHRQNHAEQWDYVYLTRCPHDHTLNYRQGKTSTSNTITHE